MCKHTTDITEKTYKFVLARLEEQRDLEDVPDSSGMLRTFSGDTVELMTRLIWTELAEKYDRNAIVIKGDYAPVKITDEDGNTIEESVDQHCYIDGKFVLAVECKTYLDKCYMQRADSDFSLMRENTNESFATAIFSLEDNIKDTSYNFFMKRGNIDKTFFFSDGKRSSNKEKRIYHTPERIQKQLIADAVEYMASFFE